MMYIDGQTSGIDSMYMKDKKPIHPTYARMMEAAAALDCPRQVDVARRLGVDPPVLNNWRLRGVPESSKPAVSALFLIPIEELEPSKHDVSDAPRPPSQAREWPFETVDRDKLADLSERALGAMEAAMIEVASRYGVDISKKSEPPIAKSA